MQGTARRPVPATTTGDTATTHCITVPQRHSTWPSPPAGSTLLSQRQSTTAPESHPATCRLNYAKTHAHHTVFDVWSTRVRELKEFGEGTMLYFYFLRWMAIMFTVLGFVASTPQVRWQ
jgi:hypothetical protein